MLSHTGRKPTNVTRKVTSRIKTSKHHKPLHIGKKPYNCDVCGLHFGQNSDLERHVCTNSEDTSYICEAYGEQFDNNSTFKNHTRTDARTHACTQAQWDEEA